MMPRNGDELPGPLIDVGPAVADYYVYVLMCAGGDPDPEWDWWVDEKIPRSRSADSRLHVGYAQNPHKRIQQHIAGRRSWGARFTSAYSPELVYGLIGVVGGEETAKRSEEHVGVSLWDYHEADKTFVYWI